MPPDLIAILALPGRPMARMKIALLQPMIRSLGAGSFVVLLALLPVCASSAQSSDSAALARAALPPAVFSIGQPPLWSQQLSAQGTAVTRDGRSGATFSYGVYRAFSKPPIAALNPLLGLIGGTAEAYGSVGGAEDAGVRVMATSRMFATSIGADWDVRHGRVNTIVSWQSAIRRGGLLGHGTMVRVDWIPERGQTVRLGIAAPLFQPLAGRTRPRETTVGLPYLRELPAAPAAPRDAATQQLVRDIASASATIAAYSDLYTDEALRASRASSYRTAMDRSRTAVEALFGAALGDAERARAARRARVAVLDRIIIPVDSLFGRARAVDVTRLAGGATADFSRWLRDSSAVAPESQPLAESAFAAWLDAVTPVMRNIVVRHRHDSRLVWLPMDLALTLDRYDDQAEVDSLIGRVVGHPFTDGNALTYMRSTDLPLEVARSILAARQYHVMWTHEFMGRNWYTRAIDDIGYTMVADAYFPALTAAVQRYDSTGVLPTYMILHDQYFYEVSDGRLWLSILEDPLGASMHLKGDDGTRERHLRERQAELRAAVEASRRLQADARASGDAAGWLHRTVKVHVNVGNPSDFSFRSSHIIPGIPFTPDNVMRDHRKLVLYDVNELDPYRGAVYVMGIGIGEAYSRASWEDRGFRVRGPATLEARAALRQALRSTGFTEDEIPVPLRAVASKAAQERKANLGEFVGRALQVHNEVGFGDKKSSVARAMLYNLAQPGAVIIVPDQLWFSETWAGMLAGAAARGARVQIIAPALANAPIPDAPAMARAHDVLTHLLELRDSLAPTLRASGGELHIGLFAAHAQADDAAGRLREVRAGLQRYPWIREVIPFDDRTLAVLDRVEHDVSSKPDATSITSDEKPRPPQPHRKTQVIARPGAIAALLRQPGWDVILADAMRVQASQTATFAEQLGRSRPAVDTASTRRADEMMRNYEASIPEAERKQVSFYFAEGSHNMDDRGLMSDGEATLIVSGPQASAGLADLFYMMARTTWLDRPADMEPLLPRPSSPMRRFAYWIRAAL
jgi:phosphatidylserine/phosphatidylglycerophosphate/cardiolipin synthase-like enzyme